jgi:TonB family protein
MKDREDHSPARRKAFTRLLQALTLTFIVLLAMPAQAAGRAVKSRVAPLYPEIAKRMKVTGSVRVEATVDADGKVTAVKTIEGNRMLATAAEDAVHKWKYESGPGETTEEVVLNFALSQ